MSICLLVFLVGDIRSIPVRGLPTRAFSAGVLRNAGTIGWDADYDHSVIASEAWRSAFFVGDLRSIPVRSLPTRAFSAGVLRNARTIGCVAIYL